MPDALTASDTPRRVQRSRKKGSYDRERARILAAQTHVPTCGLRWFRDYDGTDELQQRCTTPGGEEFWKHVPMVFWHGDRE